MKSEAEKMFEELGFEQETFYDLIYYERTVRENTVILITFNTRLKKFYCDEDDESLGIDIPLLKAINQQCRELGWL